MVLLSGGLDSATVAAIARGDGFECHALSFDYGQRHRVELDAAERVGQQMQVAAHRRVKIDLQSLAGSEKGTSHGQVSLGSALTDDLPVPKDRDEETMAGDIPVTYVPARNTIFLSYALALAEVIGSSDIFIGVNAVDYSGYPDCRPQYIEAFERMANLATRAAVTGGRMTIHTPLIDLSKVDIIRRGLALGVDFGQTHSCYDPQPAPGDESTPPVRACGRCDACLLRKRAFEALGMVDPVLGQ